MSVVTLILTSIFGIAITRRYVRNQKEEEVLPVLNTVESLWIDFSLGEIDTHNFERFMMSQSMMNNVQLVLVDQSGKLVYASRAIQDNRSDEHIEWVDLSKAKIFSDILKSHDVYSRTLEIEGSRFSSIVVGKAIVVDELTLGAVAMIVPVFELDRSAASLFIALILAFSLVSLVMIGVLYVFSKKLTKPLKSMTEVAQALSLGHFDVKADEGDPSEIGVLGHTLNQMADTLKATLSQVNFERMRLEAMLSSMKEGVLSLDLEGNIILMNPALLKLLDIEGEDQLKIILGNEPLKELLSSNKTQQLNFERQNQSILISVSPLKAQNQSPLGIIAVFIDQSESMRLEKMRRDYVANVSHELRTPLTAIRALVDPLNDQLITDEQKKLDYYQHILREIDRLNRLINDLLELSRLQSRQTAFIQERFNVERLLNDVVERFEGRIKDKQLTMDFKLELLENEWISSEDRVDQIISIFMDNAIKFTNSGSITLSASQSHQHLIIEVCDSGQGISKEDLPYIFDRFYTADQARSHKSFGLGLSIAKEIADTLGLKIEVESKENQGSCFRLIFDEAS